MANIPILMIWDAASGKYIPVPAMQGPQGPQGDKGDTGPQGPQGDKGDTGEQGPPYTLTEADKSEIAEMVLAAIPDGTEVAY